MSASRKPLSSLLSLPVIESREDLDCHDPQEPALLEIPPALVPGVWTFLQALPSHNDTGDMCRGVELWMCGLAEPSSCMMVGGLNQAARALRRLIETAQRIVDEDGPIDPGRDDAPPAEQIIAMGDGEDDAGSFREQGDDDEDDDEEGGGHGGGPSRLLH